MSGWSHPENNVDQLWISNAEDPRSFGLLFDRISAHFGEGALLSELDIEYVRFTHEHPCSCCQGSGVYGDYYVITRRKEPCQFTPALEIKDLTKD